MLLDCLNCTVCDKPFHAGIGNSRTPVADKNGNLSCRKCAVEKESFPVKFVIDLLKQPGLAFRRNSWVLLGELKPLKCPDCRTILTPESGHRSHHQIVCHHENRFCLGPAKKGLKYFDIVGCGGGGSGPEAAQKCKTCQDPLEPPIEKELSAIGLVAKYNYLVARIIPVLQAIKETNKVSNTCMKCLQPFGTGTLIVGEDQTLCKKCYDESEAVKNCVICVERHSRILEEHEKAKISEPEERCDEATEDVKTTCTGCGRESLTSRLFSCSNCNGSILCGACSVREHRNHLLVDLGAVKLAKIEAQTLRDVHQHYDGLCGNVAHVHDLIAANTKRLVAETIEHLQLISKQKAYANGVLISEALRMKVDEFEGHFEEYLPRARIYNDKLIDLSDEGKALMSNFHTKTDETEATDGQNSIKIPSAPPCEGLEKIYPALIQL